MPSSSRASIHCPPRPSLQLLLVLVSSFHVTFFKCLIRHFTFSEGVGACDWSLLVCILQVISLGYLIDSLVTVDNLSDLFSWTAQISRGDSFRIHQEECARVLLLCSRRRLTPQSAACFQCEMPALLLWNQGQDFLSLDKTLKPSAGLERQPGSLLGQVGVGKTSVPAL